MYKGAVSGFVSGFVLGATVGVLSTPKGHSIWTGKDLRPNVEASTLKANGIETSVKNSDIASDIKNAVPDYGPVKYKAEYLNKVEGLDGQHSWNRQTIEIVSDHGKIFNITGADGQQYKLIQSLGTHHGKSGVFELIINKGVIHHQRFIPGGLINGIPNQVVPGISPSVSPGIRWWK